MMRLETVVFPTSKFHRYRRMVDVLRLSVAENSPATPLSVHMPSSDDGAIFDIARHECKRAWIENCRKAKHHAQIIREAKAGELLCMIDADAMVLRPLECIENLEFDVAYTSRPADSSGWRINSGVYFVRISDATKRFFDELEQVSMVMLADEVLHHEWRTEYSYGGLHQSAFGYMLKHFESPILKFCSLPCAEWNCVDGIWSTAADPRIVHIMGQLRDCCFRKLTGGGPALQKLVERWRSYDHVAESLRMAG